MILERLITSRVRARLLVHFYTHPDEDYYLKGLVRLLGENNNAIRIELRRLEEIGLLVSSYRHGRKEYRLNKACSVYPELRGLILKTSGVVPIVREALAGVGPLEVALIYGSLAAGTERADSDIDLLVVGEVDPGELRRALRKAERLLGREINETIYDPREYYRLRDEAGSFVNRVLEGPTLDLEGGEYADRRSRT